ncbi:MAG: CpXC domain-containing protein [Chloroflexota bacterium]
MPQTQISCPNCRQMIPAQVERLFDVTADPGAKQRLLGGVSNVARCQFCGYQGQLATPIVYHDADKQLLLTYFPGELGLPVNEQEKIIGPLIKQVTERLPAEKRKAYLLQPQNHLTYQSLVERILGADGVTPEMLKAQQERVNLVQRLLQITTEDVRLEVIKQNRSLLDEQFFALFSRLMESALAGGQQELAQMMNALQAQLIENSDYGKALQSQVAEMEAAAKSLQEVGQSLTREKLLEIMLAAPNEARLRALVSMARPGMDYQFFQIFSERIDTASGEEKTRLAGLREKMLDFTNAIDKQVEAQMKQAENFINQLLQQDDIAEATRANLPGFTDAAMQVLNAMLREANTKQDKARMDKLQQIVGVLQEASAPPPEVEFIETLLGAENDEDVLKMLQENDEMVSQEFMDTLMGLAMQMESQLQQAGGQISAEEKATIERLQQVSRIALKYSMKRQMS